MDLTAVTLVELRDAIASKTVTAKEVVQAYLERIARFNPQLNVYRETYENRARDRAARVDTGELTGPLAGVPMAIKDVLCTDWGGTTCSSEILQNFEAPYTATAVAKLEAAGAIILGKTNMDEFAMGSSSETCAWGPVRNPWDDSRVPGGSSGGSAAAMAADLCAGALGTDTGGSIRQPAALCGVVGLKPTYGRVSRWGLVAFASSLDQIGPIGHTVADVALLLDAISGHDRRDSTSADVPVPRYLEALDQPLGDLRIGIGRQYMSDGNDPAVTDAIEEATRIYQNAGARIVEVDLPHTEYGIPTYYIVATAEASSNLARYDGIHYGYRTPEADDLIDLYSRSRAEAFGDEVKRRIMLGTYALSSGYYDAYYLRALKVRRLIKGDFDAVFGTTANEDADDSGRCDVILCPTTTGPAFRIGEKVEDPLAMYLNDVYTVNANLAGLPSISLPAGFAAGDTEAALPIGIQFYGPAFGEERLLRVAQVFEQATEYHRARPPL